MIFTCLEIDWMFGKDGGEGAKIFQWISDPNLSESHQEFDEKKGAFWV